MPSAPATQPTDQDWQRLTATIGRLAERLDDVGRDDLARVLDFIEQLAAPRVEPRNRFDHVQRFGSRYPR